MHAATIRHGISLNGTSFKRQIKTQENEIFATRVRINSELPENHHEDAYLQCFSLVVQRLK